MIIVTPDIVNGVCSGENTGSITILVTGGIPPYTYQWTRNGVFFSTDKDIYNLSSGTYSVVVTDNVGNTSTNSVVKVYDFLGATGHTPLGNLIQYNNLLYGLCSQGVNSGVNGTIFKTTLGGTLTRIYTFDPTTGTNPQAALMLASDGLMYGTAPNDGANSKGVIFSFDPVTETYTDLYDFTGTDGGFPHCTLIEVSGTLYGTTRDGGTNDLGVIFSYVIATNTYTKLFDMAAATGSNPEGSLILYGSGVFYGTARGGGANSKGVLFSFNTTGNVYTDVYDFGGVDGDLPRGDLLLASNRFMYGLTFQGGVNNLGVIFKFNPATATYTKLFDFTTLLGANPKGSLIEANGLLYGLTSLGGVNNEGVIFTFNLLSNTSL